MDEWMIHWTGAIITTTSATLSPCFVVAKTMGRLTPAAGRDDNTEKLQSGIFVYKLSILDQHLPTNVFPSLQLINSIINPP